MAFKPNRDLLNVNFEGYKLSESPLTCLKQAIEGAVHLAQLKDGDFSYQHMKAYSLHNHLTTDPYDDKSVYWCNQDGSIQKGTFVGSTESLALSAVYSGSPSDSAGNSTLVFVNAELCLYSRGSREMTVIYTGRRTENSKWEEIQSFTLSESYPIMVVAAAVTPGDSSSIQVLCAELQDPSVTSADTPTSSSANKVKPTIAKYTWYCLQFKNSTELSVDSPRHCIEGINTELSFNSQSRALYAAFQSNSTNSSTYLLFMSETTPLLSSLKAVDTETSLPPPDESPVIVDEEEPGEDGGNHFGLGYDSQGYDWSQTDTDVVIRFELPKGMTKKDVDCVISSKELVAGLTDGTTFFRGELNEAVDTEASTWTIENDTLEVTLEKKRSGLQWPYLHHGEKKARHHVLLSEGREGDLTNEELDKIMADDKNSSDKYDRPPDAKRPRPLMSTELEDCDSTEEDSTLYVIAQDGSLAQKASLSGRQLVFTSPSPPGHAPHFALRHDVDAVVWLPPPTTHSSPTEPSWTHVDTFNALGYVQASKENRKFTTSPPNLKLAAISDCNRHVFVYAQSDQGFRSNTAQEFVHTLSEKTDILGLAASNDGLVFVLTAKALFGLKVPL